MKITFLGTAAAEAYPAVFCECESCREARKFGGKNIRTRSQAIINNDFLIDLPADTYMHFLNNDIDGNKIKYLLITHSHGDHFYPLELAMRHGASIHKLPIERLKMYCNKGSYEKFEKMPEREYYTVDAEMLKPYEEVNFGEYSVIPLPARHFEGDEALFYIIKQDNKTILYAHDTGFFYDEVFDYIKENKFVFDLVSYDCTYVDLECSDEWGHMGIDNIKRVEDKLKEMGAVTDKTVQIVNHFSHNGNPFHSRVEELVKDRGYLVSYDGMSVEI